MGFWSGFLDQYNKIEDRKQREELLNKELAEKRRSALITLASKASKRGAVAKDETGALKALSARVGNAEGGKEWLDSVAQAGAGSKIMSMIQKFESDPDSKELYLKGNVLMENFTPYYDKEGQPSVKVPSPQELINMSREDLLNNETYMQRAMDLSASSTAPSEPFVDVDPRSLYAASNKAREEAMDEFDRLLIEKYDTANLSEGRPEDVKTMQAIRNLNSTDKEVRAIARKTLMVTPQGFEAFNEMLDMSGTIPSYGVIATIPGKPQELNRLRQIIDNWDRVTEENKAKALQRYPFIEKYVNG